MKIFIANDHAATELKFKLIGYFQEHQFVNLGTDANDSVDYPDYAQELCSKVLAEKDTLGMLLCGSGIGMSISANRYEGIRAALAMNPELAKLAKEHNNANVLVLGSRFLSFEQAVEITKSWLSAEFAAGRHQKRISKIDTK